VPFRSTVSAPHDPDFDPDPDPDLDPDPHRLLLQTAIQNPKSRIQNGMTLGPLHVSQVQASWRPRPLPFAFQGAQGIAASQRWASLPFAFQTVASVRNPKSRIEGTIRRFKPGTIQTIQARDDSSQALNLMEPGKPGTGDAGDDSSQALNLMDDSS